MELPFCNKCNVDISSKSTMEMSAVMTHCTHPSCMGSQVLSGAWHIVLIFLVGVANFYLERIEIWKYTYSNRIWVMTIITQVMSHMVVAFSTAITAHGRSSQSLSNFLLHYVVEKIEAFKIISTEINENRWLQLGNSCDEHLQVPQCPWGCDHWLILVMRNVSMNAIYLEFLDYPQHMP